MIKVILKDLLNHFEINENLPDYLLNQRFNEVFLDGDFSFEDNEYKIVVKTRQNVIHMMFIKPNEEFPLIILSELPNGLLNGMKFGQNEGEEFPINKL
ncbi:hypothetical protein [Methanobrevibacter sp.]|uniref:hypothetical protein n=1 Tax=Methanobrevibacter sp. TaxID=66852 RepID=UPI0025E3F576|nr:hypothetical protein [Methanobrevibacter sp.]MBR4447397.1 hypothetical protein [Methanobrevibacter sp.]